MTTPNVMFLIAGTSIFLFFITLTYLADKAWRMPKGTIHASSKKAVLLLFLCFVLLAIGACSLIIGIGLITEKDQASTVNQPDILNGKGGVVVAVIKNGEVTYFVAATKHDQLPLVAIRSLTGTEFKVGDAFTQILGDLDILPNRLLPIIHLREVPKIEPQAPTSPTLAPPI
ncbi:MAG TPA: hypothetical protein VJG65_00415 [Patescibacteria group bacterium]|nr:hypothetical protein [Patescibacteria group bacterium]